MGLRWQVRWTGPNKTRIYFSCHLWTSVVQEIISFETSVTAACFIRQGYIARTSTVLFISRHRT